MYTRLTILSVIIIAAVCGLGGLGYHAIGKWAQGLEGARLGEFAEVAEQIRQDVKRKLDGFILAEQQRKYTEYLYNYVPENIVGVQEQLPFLRSPLGDQFSNSIAYGYFQIEPDGNIVTPYYQGEAPQPRDNELVRDIQEHVLNVRENVLPLLTKQAGTLQLPLKEARTPPEGEAFSFSAGADTIRNSRTVDKDAVAKTKSVRSKAYPIESLKQEAQESQVFTQSRSIAASNWSQSLQRASQQQMEDAASPPAQTEQITPGRTQVPESLEERRKLDIARTVRGRAQGSAGTVTAIREQNDAAVESAAPQTEQSVQAPTPDVSQQVTREGLLPDTVQVQIEPFVPIVVPDPNNAASIFGGQVFLLRHVRIEDRHLLQGFRLDEPRLIAEVEESARRFAREDMAFSLPQVRQANGPVDRPDETVAYTAILDFGFGDLVLALREIDPHWVAKRIGELHWIYFGIVTIVAAAVVMALASLWHNMRAQVKLAQKKDDFISAVSHELRTPLTSIRMYSEMLEKNWVKSPDKLTEYYRSMRQESERLSRLVENVLDFARLQKGRKRYSFELGNIDSCVGEVAAMMTPYAEQQGFVIQTQLDHPRETCFDRDAVTQIVVNLIDNAVKYARCAADKTITVRTRTDTAFTIIEVEDHGPGIPHRQRRKVFDQFYRCDDAPAEGVGRNGSATAGTGLGLTLVKRFAEAHSGYVAVHAAHPAGVILEVGLAERVPPRS